MHCPHCSSIQTESKGFYFVKWKSKYLKRYRCRGCKKSFSRQTLSVTKNQKKPYLNKQIAKLLCSGVSERRTAFILDCSKLTIARRLQWLYEVSEKRLESEKLIASTIQFDEMFSIEHTKLKPLSIALAVTEDHKIAAVRVGRIPAQGHLKKFSVKKYGRRKSEKEKILNLLFQDLKSKGLSDEIEFISDSDVLYPKHLKRYFPNSKHTQVSSRSQIQKKKELLFTKEQKNVFDPLFALNHKCATLRDHIKRLARRNWCTTKKPENLEKHLVLYQAFSNGLLNNI